MHTIVFTVIEELVGGVMGGVYRATVTLEAGYGPALL